ncbi:hypothetical protein [Parafilimonas terrae]|uniref:Spore coat polysaccharide biosynthesis protein SpsG, predicted glycosyltransferase n=1 Tax=Parafilimonas terrae TaxID=1465490 RepID=A0A1I5X3L2_9BACT|nr:hypothetical protein [Parafilimonas terrae]SFQ26528.1 Spore coat polysaccharide biosynthesis protein SpsG, predicted glycosyltransferase [Parafilimonas terrae]
MATSTYLFRFDAGAQHGLGHFSRSIAIAKQLLNNKPDAEIIILSAATAYMREKKNELPFRTILVDEINENIVLNYVKNIRPGVLFFDKLEELNKNTITALQDYTKLILFHNYSRYVTWADVIIMPAAHIDINDLRFQHVPDKGPAKIYAGPDYVVMNEAALQLRPLFKIRNKANTVAVTTGGSDPKGVMISLLEKIDFKKFNDINFIFFIGDDFLHKEKLNNYTNITNAKFLPFDMKAITTCDIVISTFGVTTYELLYTGMPVISVGHAATNAKGSKYLAANYNCILDIGHIDDIKENELNSAINLLIQDADTRVRLHQTGRNLIDGKGAERVCDIIMQQN